MIENVGEMSFEDFDDANIPVDIWLSKLKADDEHYEAGHRFRLKCGNYMPRKGHVEEVAVEVLSDNLEELQALVRGRIIPIYQIAMRKLEKMAEGKCNNLYYWSEPDDDDKIEND